MTFEGLSSACAKLETPGSKINEILKINVLKKFTSHALFHIHLHPCRYFNWHILTTRPITKSSRGIVFALSKHLYIILL